MKHSSMSKLSADGRGVERKWWFTILAPVDTLSIIDTSWHLLSARCSWSLQHSLKSSGHPPAFKSPVHKHVNKGSGSVVSSGDLQCKWIKIVRLMFLLWVSRVLCKVI